MQAGTSPRATGEGEEAGARLAGIRQHQAIAVWRFHMHTGGQPGEAADTPGAVQAALQGGELLRGRGALLAGGAGLAVTQRLKGHLALAAGDQLFEFGP